MSSQGARIEKTLRVPVITLDDWWADQGDPPIEIIKLDIQAGRAQALPGGSNSAITLFADSYPLEKTGLYSRV